MLSLAEIIKFAYKDLFFMTSHKSATPIVVFLLLTGIIWLTITSTTATATPQYPPETDFTAVASSALTSPSYLNSVIDPLFSTEITRITDKATYNAYGNTLGYINYHPTQPYPKNPTWNSDGTYLRLGNTLIDGTTYAIVKDIEGHIYERKWSYTDPNIIYAIDHHNGTYNFVKQDVRNPEFVNVVNLISFSDVTYDGLYIGPWEGNLTFDDQLVALTATNGNDMTVFLYNLVTDTIMSQHTFPNIWDRIDWVSVSPLGSAILINYVKYPANPNSNFRSAIDQYDTNFNFIRELAHQGEHGDMGVDENGQEVYVQFEFGTSDGGEDRRGIWMYALSDGQETELLPEKYGGGHVSCRNYSRPGWCYLSLSQEGYKETIAVKLKIEAGDTYAQVNRFGQHHSQSLDAQSAPNPDGSKVVFSSNWGAVGAEPDAYIATLPLVPTSVGNLQTTAVSGHFQVAILAGFLMLLFISSRMMREKAVRK